MLFKLYDYEMEEYLNDTPNNIDWIIDTINVCYAYEEWFIDITYKELWEFLLNAHLQLIPV